MSSAKFDPLLAQLRTSDTTDISGLVPKTTTVNGHPLSSNVVVTATDVGLGNVDNTSDVNKPVSTAQATADGLRVLKAGDTMTGPLTIANGTQSSNTVVLDINASALTNSVDFHISNLAAANVNNQASFVLLNQGSAGLAYVAQFQGIFNNIVTNNSLILLNGFNAGAYTRLMVLDGTAVTFYGLVTIPSLTVNGNLTLSTAGNKLNIAVGTNASAGTALLAAGTITVSTTAVTANSLILLTTQASGTLANLGTHYISAKTAGTSFVISSSNILDNSTVAWLIVN